MGVADLTSTETGCGCGGAGSGLLTVDAEQSVYEAVSALRHSAVHRLVVVDYISGNPLYVLTYRRVLTALHQRAVSPCVYTTH